MSYLLKIGLEVHVELASSRKLFCTCPTEFGQAANSQVCPVCLGEPGFLPQLNIAVLDLAVAACLGLECRISSLISFDRKHYQSPDMPKGYQLTQYYQPLGRAGRLEIAPGQFCRIRQVHLEEDSGRTLSGSGLIDFNRSGVPLLEIVTEPDLTSADQAVDFLKELRRLLLFLAVSDCRMEEGSMRVDVNVSLAVPGLATRAVEIKNLNSFRAVKRAIAAEKSRQEEILQADGQIESQTRGWADRAGQSFFMRVKKPGEDYRYCPEPALAPLVIEADYITRQRAGLAELPWAAEKRLQEEFSLSRQQSKILTAEPELAGFFSKTARLCQDPAAAANWMLGSVAATSRELGLELSQSQLKPANLARLIQLVQAKKISRTNAEQLLPRLMQEFLDLDQYIASESLTLMADPADLSALVQQVLAEETAAVTAYLAGKEKVKTFLLGRLMQKSRGQADPHELGRILTAELARRNRQE